MLLTSKMLKLPEVGTPQAASQAAAGYSAATGISSEVAKYQHQIWDLRSKLLRCIMLILREPAHLCQVGQQIFAICNHWFEQSVAAAFEASADTPFLGSPTAYMAMNGMDLLHACVHA